MDKKVIKVQYKRVWAMYLFIALLVGLTSLIYFSFEREEGDIANYLWWIAVAVMIALMIFFALLNIQNAVLSEEGIEIRSILFSIKNIRWDEIVDIRIQDLPSADAGGYMVYLPWIVIYTDQNQYRSYGGGNKKKKGPWYICAKTENILAINPYLEKYTKLDTLF